MILLGLGLLLGAAVTLAVVFWDKLKKLVTDVYERLPQFLKDELQGFVTILKIVDKVMGRFHNIVRQYFYDQKEDRWTRQTTTEHIEEDEVPPEFKAKVKKSPKGEIDITEEFQEELEMAS